MSSFLLFVLGRFDCTLLAQSGTSLAVQVLLSHKVVQSPNFLVIWFGAASGFMILLVVTELYPEANANWCCITEHHDGAAVATFVGGAVLAALLHELTHWILHRCFRSGSHPITSPDAATEKTGLLAHDSPPSGGHDRTPVADLGLSAGKPEANGDAVGLGPEEDLGESAVHVAVGLGLHNLPEGFLLFLNVLAGEQTGTLLFVAVALHNVPIGAVVGATTLAATGSRWRAVGTAAAVGAIFPLAGLIAYGAGDVLGSPSVAAATFGLTAGILIFVCVRELLPKVFRADKTPHSSVATGSIFAGMVAMGTVMVLLSEFGGHSH